MKTILYLAIYALGVCTPYKTPVKADVEGIKLPPGFQISYFARDVKNARSLALGDQGTVFVSSRKEGKIYALVDSDKDYKADRTYLIAENLNMPNGITFRNGDLYVAEVSKIYRFSQIEKNLPSPPKGELLTDKYPSDEHHGWKYIAFGPDDKLYVPVGAPCNICERKDQPIYSSITTFDIQTKEIKVVAHGVRNSVGFDWDDKGKLWFTENGRDWAGDDIPPDELNKLDSAGQHFGFPYCHGGKFLDEEFGSGNDCKNYTSPVQNLGPHVAALGMKFSEGNMFPAEFKNGVFIAEHGSWNRSTPLGYRVTFVKLDGDKAVSYTPFAEGWLKGNKAWGRPVDVMFLPDGSMLVTDDHADAVYRITYSK